MHNLEQGENVLVPCDVSSGAFPGEQLITVNTEDGVISGFVRGESLVERNGSGFFVRGEIREVYPKSILVWLRGSFFTTNGLANIARDRLKSV